MVSIVLALVWFPLAPHTSTCTISKGHPGSDVLLFWPTPHVNGDGRTYANLAGSFPF